MTVYPELRMEATVDVSLGQCLSGVRLPGNQTASLRQQSALARDELDRFSRVGIDVNSESASTIERVASGNYKHLLNNNYLYSAGSERSGVKRSPEADRVVDALSRSEKLLLADGNVRSRSRTKSLIYTDETNTLPSCTSSAKSRKASANYRLQQLAGDGCDLTVASQLGRVTASDGKQEEDESNYFIDEANTSNNATRDGNVVNIVYGNKKKVKKHRKRPKSSLRSKKPKPGRVTVPSTGYHPNKDHHASMHTSHSLPQQVIRVSSEPPSKHSPYLSFTHLGSNQSRPPAIESRTNHTEPSSPVKQILLKTVNCTNVSEINHSSLQVHAQPKPLMSQSDNDKRVQSAVKDRTKSSSSAKLIKDRPCVKGNAGTSSPQFGLSTKSLVSTAVKNNTGVNCRSSPVSTSKESSLISIYAPHAKNNEDFGKIRKIFLSEKQSPSIKECGVELPCAPPATPTPDVLKRYEYVPSMNDIRSQQAVRNRLRVIERDAQKRLEKQKEARLKLEKQMSKDREKNLKAQQRLEIYALNKVMTELEHHRFKEFCGTKGLKT